ncbi:MAG: hypothetical protein ACE5HD_03735 [Acidobacteriota bacterium]
MKPDRTRQAQSGSVLLESLVSLALGLIVIAVALPLLLWSRCAAADTADRAARADGARLSVLRLIRESRRAGFGLAGEMEAFRVAETGDRVSLVFLEGGFRGGLPVLEPAPSGARSIVLGALGTLRAGDEVALRDREGRFASGRIERLTRDPLTVVLAAGLPFPVSPESGARLYRVCRREWLLAGGVLRRDGQPILDPPVGFSLTAGAGAPDEALSWVVARGLAGSPGSVAGPLLMAQLTVGSGRPGQAAPGSPCAGHALREVRLPVVVQPQHGWPENLAASPLP